MLLTDYFRSEHDITWDFARQCGVDHGVIRLPEDPAFDVCDPAHWRTVHKRFTDFGIKPVIIEPMPNALHDHIKAGDAQRDQSIEKVIQMFHIMESLDIRTICFNFMAHVGWTRTSSTVPERGGALVTEFNLQDYVPTQDAITAAQLWDNYTYFINAVLPHAEKHGIRLALHPDDPPLPRLGSVERIMVSYENIRRAIYDIAPSPMLGVTFCQATFHMMGEDLFTIVPELAEKIFFVHFRNCTGTKTHFRETFHDNGEIPMADILRLYQKCGVDVPIRVDHVPLLAGEQQAQMAGYSALGRLYALGYLKGLLEQSERN